MWLQEVITGADKKSLQIRHRWSESSCANFGSLVDNQSDGSVDVIEYIGFSGYLEVAASTWGVTCLPATNEKRNVG